MRYDREYALELMREFADSDEIEKVVQTNGKNRSSLREIGHWLLLEESGHVAIRKDRNPGGVPYLLIVTLTLLGHRALEHGHLPL